MSPLVIGIGIFVLLAVMVTGGYLLFKRSKKCTLDCGAHGTLNASGCSCQCAPFWEGPSCATPTPRAFAASLEAQGWIQPDGTGGCPQGYGTVQHHTPGGSLTMCDPNVIPDIIVTTPPAAATAPPATNTASPAAPPPPCATTTVTCSDTLLQSAVQLVMDQTGASNIEIRESSTVQPNACDIAITLYPSGKWEKRRVTYRQDADCNWKVATVGGPLTGQTVDVGVTYDWNQ